MNCSAKLALVAVAACPPPRDGGMNSGTRSSFCRWMRWPTPGLVLCLLACSGPESVVVDGAPVAVVDAANRPLPHAVVWAAPGDSWARLAWTPPDLLPFVGNRHELLRRLGTRHVADDTGIVTVPRGSVLAGQRGRLAGVELGATRGRAPERLVLDEHRWEILVRDAAGKPAAGVPVACATDQATDGQFEGLSLGLTDAAGRLVVRAPDAVPLPQGLQISHDDVEVEPDHVFFEVEGMYLARHTQMLDRNHRGPASVALTMPTATKIEVHVPDWSGPIGEAVHLTRVGKAIEWDGTYCWREGGKWVALVGVSERVGWTPIEVQIDGTTVRCQVDVPIRARGERFGQRAPEAGHKA